MNPIVETLTTHKVFLIRNVMLYCLFCFVLGLTIGYFTPRPREYKPLVQAARERMELRQSDYDALIKQYLELHFAELTGESK